MNDNSLENKNLSVNGENYAEEPANRLPLVESEEKMVEETGEIVSEETLDTREPDFLASHPDESEESVSQSDDEFLYEPEISEDEEEPNLETGEDRGVSENESMELPPVEEIVRKLRDLFESEHLQRKEAEEARDQFYRSLRNETQRQKAAFLEAGGESIDFIVNELPIYAEGKALIRKIKEKRAEIQAREDAEKERNVAKKMAIIDQIKYLTEKQDQEDFKKTYQEFRSLQQQWNEIKPVPKAKVNELWKEFQRYVEKFYDLVRINNEFREYDFKKNLEQKIELCEAAERLDDEPDVISAFHQLQKLHQQWREIGPVSHNDREEIWNRFKAASSRINKKRQLYMESRKEKESENLAAKIALCEQIEAIDYSKLTGLKDWNDKTREVSEIKKEWHELMRTAQRWDPKIYERYRAACNFFHRNRNEFLQSMYGDMNENLNKKMALCERVEALKDSRDWKKTSRQIIEIQREWREIGPVPHKQNKSIWQRFNSACDYFFEQKKIHTSSKYEEEINNLEKKKEIVEKIRNLDEKLSPEQLLPLLQELIEDWNNTGHVPFKSKDKVYKEFREAVDAQYDKLNIDKNDRKLGSFKSSLSDMEKSENAREHFLHEREKLMRQYDRMKTELQTYENNIGFLSVSSKKGNSLLDEMNQKMKKIKSELELLVKKIEAIDEKL